MLGRSHSTSGAVLALAAEPLLASAGVPLTGWSILVLAISAAGGAMLPDFDHRQATIAHSLGPVTKLLAIGIEKVSGGHRNGTHSLLGLAVTTVIAWGVVQFGGWPLAIWLGFLFAVALAGLQMKFTPRSVILHTLLCLAGGWWLMTSALKASFPFDATIWGVAIGYLAHLFGDALTIQGVPFLLPINKTRFKVAAITTGQFAERFIIGPLLGLCAVGLTIWALARHHVIPSAWVATVASWMP